MCTIQPTGTRLDAAADTDHLAALVTCRIRQGGRHHLGDRLLDALTHVRNGLDVREAHLRAFLDAVLARRQGRFVNQTYLALEFVELVREDLDVDPETMSALLIADVVRHERRDVTALDTRTRVTRIRHALHFVEAADPTVDMDDGPGGWFDLTALPVSTEHDEYFFIRALQAHEMVFTTMTELMRAATGALRNRDVRGAVRHLTRAGVVLDRAAMLFRLVATMRPADFHAFRQYTEGASAIQSEAYKRFELACGAPSPARLTSEAFGNVPAVRAEAPFTDNLSRAWRDLAPRGPEADALTQAVDALEQGHQRWKTTHHSLAAAMLGDAHGSGYTEGVPYLRACLDNRLFDVVAACPMAA